MILFRSKNRHGILNIQEHKPWRVVYFGPRSRNMEVVMQANSISMLYKTTRPGSPLPQWSARGA